MTARTEYVVRVRQGRQWHVLAVGSAKFVCQSIFIARKTLLCYAGGGQTPPLVDVEARRLKVHVLDLDTGDVASYATMGDAAASIGCARETVGKYANLGRALDGRYAIAKEEPRDVCAKNAAEIYDDAVRRGRALRRMEERHRALEAAR